MKRWIGLLLAVAFLLQTACDSAPRAAVPQPDILERTEVVLDADLDQQAEYPAERPSAQEPLPTEETEETTEKPETPPAEETEQPSEVQVSTPPVQETTPPESKPPETKPSEEPPPPPEPVKPAEEPKPQEPPKQEPEPEAEPVRGEVRAMWFSYFEYATLLTGQGEAAFTKNIRNAFQNVANYGMNTVIVQVRPFADALYPSEYFPWSYLAAGEEGRSPGFDPLKIMVKEAHNQGLSIEAWINPYRVRNGSYKHELADDSIVWDYLESGDAVRYNGGIYFDPSSKRAQELIVNGVREIVDNYRVDGIHFDDYFYPTTDKAFDAEAFKAYKDGGGRLELGDWRRKNVNNLVSSVYEAIKEEDEDCIFGISPQGNMDNNYSQQFIDVELWLSEEGYVDYICPQIYFGFENDTCPYKETVAQWNDLVTSDGVRLFVGLSPFKIGTEDTWAGSGKQEWKNNSDLLSRMVTTARREDNYQGFVLFRYDSVFHPAQGVKGQVEKELNNLKEVLD